MHENGNGQGGGDDGESRHVVDVSMRIDESGNIEFILLDGAEDSLPLSPGVDDDGIVCPLT
jgi:hypothetical protein